MRISFFKYRNNLTNFHVFRKLKALLHFHGSHHGSSRILIRCVPACDTTISSRCRCGYVPNWVYTRASTDCTVSPRTDKVATRTTPETHTELTRISRKSTEATGYFYGPYTEVYVVYWDISRMLTGDLSL